MDLDSEYAEYRAYIEDFAKTIDPDDQLPLRVAGYCLRDYEIHGECLDWLNNYLGRGCPTTLRTYLIPQAMKLIMEKTQEFPEECGFDENRMVFLPLKLVRIVVGIVNNIILGLQDNSKLYEVPLPPSSQNATELTKLKAPMKVSSDAIKNTRRTMEDRMMIIDDFNAYFNINDSEPTFYYGIYDGHSGSDAATYSNSHLNYNIAVHPKYPSDIETAMREAFLVTDMAFLKKARAENLNSGTTALCAILRKTEKKLYIGWCGDSQALIARVGNVRQIVTKHSPEDEKERKRIENLGGIVLFWGNSFRVSGTLAVSRAIGDAEHKPFVTAEPDIEIIDLDGEEDFIVLGCDGLWDALNEDTVAITVYKMLRDDPQSYKKAATRLCALAKESGSRDNISVIVVYLKEPQLIATQSWPSFICENNRETTMENLNVYDDPAMDKPVQVTLDAHGNTTQDFYNNIFDLDANNELINEVAIGKPTEITDMVMQQQQQQQQAEHEFVNFSDTLNSINNNKFNNGHDENIFQTQEQFEASIPAIQIEEQNGLTSNDTNNNSNDNFGPETDVDAIEEDFHVNSPAIDDECVKEKFQVELKETEDVVVDHLVHDTMNFGTDVDVDSATNEFNLESKIFEELSHQNPGMIDVNPFAADSNLMDSETEDAGFYDNKAMEDHQQVESHDYDEMDKFFGSGGDSVPQFTNEIVQKTNEFIMMEATKPFVDDMMSANDHVENEINMQEQMPEHEPEISESVHQTVGESGGEDSEDEWNYVKIDKKIPEGLAAVEETLETVESPVVETKEVVPEEIITSFEENVQEETPYQNEFEKSIEQSEDKFVVESEPIQESHEQLELTTESQDFDEMSVQLNPDAKEFVPVSPTRTVPLNNLLSLMDPVVSQSPMKGDNPFMEDNITLPSEKDFDHEAEVRPHDLEEKPTDFMNLKEAMQQDDKLEQEYKDETQNFQEEVKDICEEYNEKEKSFSEYSNGFQNNINDAMNRSFYEGRDVDLMPEATLDILNKCQPIPTFDDEDTEDKHQQITNGTGVSEIHKNDAPVFEMGDSSDFFEPEKFVEEIKKANGDVDKYTDQELSPTFEVSPTFAAPPQLIVDEPVEMKEFEQISSATPSENTVQEQTPLQEEVAAVPVVEVPSIVVAKEPETKAEKKPTTASTAKKTPSKPATSSVSQVKSSPAVSSTKLSAAKSPAVSKSPAASRSPAVSKDAKAAAAKAPVPVQAKPPPIRKPTTATSTVPKPAVAAVPAKPKPAVISTTTTSAIRKTTSATSASSSIAAPKTSTLVKKTTTTSVAPKPASRPASAQVKPKVPSTVTEKKTLVSSAPATRAPISKLSSTAPAKPRVSPSTAPKAATTASTMAKKTLSKTGERPEAASRTSATTVTRTITRPATTTVSKTSTLKSPTSAGTIGLAATKKPLVERKAVGSASTTTKTTTTVKKTSSSPQKTASSTVKKTTSVVQQKKIVNGDVVVEQTKTVELNGDNQLIDALEKLEMNGHQNGLTANGSGESPSMVIDTAAD